MVGEQERREPKSNLMEVVKRLGELQHAERRKEATEVFERALESLPFDVRERTREILEAERRELLAAGMPETAAQQFLVRRVQREQALYLEAFEDKRFAQMDPPLRIAKDEYAKVQAQEEIDAIFRNEEPTYEDLQRIARLSFDANGLKAVNDLTGSHEKGTLYLKKIAEVFSAPQGPTRTWLRERGIREVLATTGGGDEYSVLLVSDVAISPETITEALHQFEQEVQSISLVDAQGKALLDFGDPAVAKRVEAIRASMPEGFEFHASISGGGATLADGLEHALSGASGDRKLQDQDDYRRSLQKLMGGIWEAADERAVEAKRAFKEALQRGEQGSPEHFYSLLLSRTQEAQSLEGKVRELEQRLRGREVTLAEFTGMVTAGEKAGVPAAQILEWLKARTKDIPPIS